VCSPSIPTPKPPPPPPPAPIPMADTASPTTAARAKRGDAGFGLDLLTIPLMSNNGMRTGTQIPGTR
jgi:hypothetical protein